MLWALLAAFLTRKPPLVQAAVVGLCVGLLVATAAQANEREPSIQSTVLLVLGWGCVAGALFYAGLVFQRRHGWVPDEPGPRWLYGVYTVIWLFGLLAAVMALIGAGGFKVAVLTVVPLVLIAPTALQGIRMGLHRAPA
jgi:type III secretory pathway component EscS